MVSIASRASWGARYQDGVGNRAVGNLNRYLHHSVTKHLSPNATVAEEREQVRVIEAIGQQRFGRGMSYTFIVFPSGRIYQGASVGRISYHSGGSRNTDGVGICLAGNYEANPMTDRVVDAVAQLLNHGVAKGWWKSATITAGHRDFKATSCPGKNAYAKRAAIGTRAKALKGGSTPTTPPTPTTPSKPSGKHVISDAEITKRLKAMGFKSVAAYQKAQLWPVGKSKLVADGVWGPVTEAHYQWVRKLQSTLNKWKGVSIRVDGDYGSVTRGAVRTVQSRNRLGAYKKAGGSIVDGIPGPVTCRMLGIPTHP